MSPSTRVSHRAGMPAAVVVLALSAVVPVQADTLLTGANCGAADLITTGTTVNGPVIGCDGTGALTIDASASGNGITAVTANLSADIGLGIGWQLPFNANLPSNGTIVVTGDGTAASATLSVLSGISLGLNGGSGTLTVQNGGLAQTTSGGGAGPILIGGGANSSGTVIVDGAGSEVKVRGPVRLGTFDNSSGTLTVSNGSFVRVNSGQLFGDSRVLVGGGTGSGTNSLTVTGFGSFLSAGGLQVGNGAGTSGGTVTVADSASMTLGGVGSGSLNQDSGLSIGADAPAVAGDPDPATVIVTGGADIGIATLTSGAFAGKEVRIGGFGSGTLIIDNATVEEGPSLELGGALGGANVTVNVSGGVDGTSTSSPGLLTVKNGGLLSVSTVNVYANGTVNGDGFIGADVINRLGGVVDPGNSPGTLTIGGDYTQQSDGNLIIEIAGSNAGEYDVLNISGTATFDAGANISLVFLNGFVPTAGDVFNFLVANSFTGSLNLVDFTVTGIDPGLLNIGFSNGGTFGASVVPVPPAAWLFASALGLIGLARKRPGLVG